MIKSGSMILLLVTVLTLNPNLTQFKQHFNNYSDRYRLVMLVSPT